MKITRLLACILVSGTCAQAQILFFDFNKMSGYPAETVSSGTSALIAYNKQKGSEKKDKKEKWRSKSGEGVTGQSGDYALDFREVAMMGNDGQGPAAVVPGSDAALANLKSFTLSGWYKVQEPVSYAARLLEMYNLSTQGFFLACNEGNLALEVNKHRILSSDIGYSQVNVWVFFAVTFDGTQKIQNVTFYVGTKEKGLTSKTGNLAVENPLPESGGTLTMGNSGGFERPLKGLMDNFAVYGSTTNGSGRLTEEQVTQLFKETIDKMVP